MDKKLSYIEESLKQLSKRFPEYYEHTLSGEELSDFIFMLMKNYSALADKDRIVSESESLITGDFFLANRDDIISGHLDPGQRSQYKRTFSHQNESSFLVEDYDIATSRMIRYMPAQWHQSSYFFIFFVRYGDCRILFRNEGSVLLKKGDILILAPFVEHATPCYEDDALLEYLMVRSSSFEKVFWDQLNKGSIMSHFFRNALNRDKENSTSYLLFETGYDEDIFRIIDQVQKEVRDKLPYSSSLINALTSALFSLTLRRYEHTVILPSDEDRKWKKEYSGVFSYIQNNYTSASLQDVADHCGYSSKQISRIVYSFFNMSYSKLITFLKMDKALSMLKEGTSSVEEISAYLGYSDLPSFYRAFKKYYRASPVSYMKKEEL